MLGYFIWCFNDQEWLDTCLHSFRSTTDVDCLVGMLNGCTDKSADFLERYCDIVVESVDPVDLSKVSNAGHEILIELGCDYIGQMHPDMFFPQKGWVDILKKTLDTYPQVGRISPENEKHPTDFQDVYPGNEAGNLIRASTYLELGGYDERYIGCGGYEDWDIQRRYIQAGLGTYINPAARVWHRHAGTREKIDHGFRHQQWLHNQAIYYNTWNTYDNAMVPDAGGHLPPVR